MYCYETLCDFGLSTSSLYSLSSPRVDLRLGTSDCNLHSPYHRHNLKLLLLLRPTPILQLRRLVVDFEFKVVMLLVHRRFATGSRLKFLSEFACYLLILVYSACG
jgi:hypothetical protein